MKKRIQIEAIRSSIVENVKTVIQNHVGLETFAEEELVTIDMKKTYMIKDLKPNLEEPKQIKKEKYSENNSLKVEFHEHIFQVTIESKEQIKLKVKHKVKIGDVNNFIINTYNP